VPTPTPTRPEVPPTLPCVEGQKYWNNAVVCRGGVFFLEQNYTITGTESLSASLTLQASLTISNGGQLFVNGTLEVRGSQTLDISGTANIYVTGDLVLLGSAMVHVTLVNGGTLGVFLSMAVLKSMVHFTWTPRL
jgi:hypothetical protein